MKQFMNFLLRFHTGGGKGRPLAVFYKSDKKYSYFSLTFLNVASKMNSVWCTLPQYFDRGAAFH